MYSLFIWAIVRFRDYKAIIYDRLLLKRSLSLLLNKLPCSYSMGECLCRKSMEEIRYQI